MVTQMVGLNGIAVQPNRMRKLREDAVKALAESIAKNGLLHPIILRPRPGVGYFLVAGHHRLAAVKQLKHEAIRAEIHDGMEALAAQLAEVDENLMHAELSPAERAAHVARRKELYEEMYPETKHGGDRKSKKSSAQNEHSFVEDAVKKTGKSRPTIQREAKRGKDIPDVAGLADTSLDKGDELDALIKLQEEDNAAAENLIGRAMSGEKVSAKTELKKVKRAAKELATAEATKAAAVSLGTKIYGVIYADPPWRFEPYSRETGMDRSADNHYGTEDTFSIAKIKVPVADDCVLFLWATVPMVEDALSVMENWGFKYKSHFVWIKDKIGTGYWTRNKHELLLIGTRGNIPAPAPGEQFDSAISAPVGIHSEKPVIFREMIGKMFPNLPKLEMFAREGGVQGWDVWGNEALNVAA